MKKKNIRWLNEQKRGLQRSVSLRAHFAFAVFTPIVVPLFMNWMTGLSQVLLSWRNHFDLELKFCKHWLTLMLFKKIYDILLLGTPKEKFVNEKVNGVWGCHSVKHILCSTEKVIQLCNNMRMCKQLSFKMLHLCIRQTCGL